MEFQDLYLEDEMTREEEAEAMQRGINSGEVWHMEGASGRAAMAFIEAGLCMLGQEGHEDYWGNYVPSRDEVEPGTKGSEEYCREREPDILENLLELGL